MFGMESALYKFQLLLLVLLLLLLLLLCEKKYYIYLDQFDFFFFFSFFFFFLARPCIRRLRPQYERQSQLSCPTETARQ